MNLTKSLIAGFATLSLCVGAVAQEDQRTTADWASMTLSADVKNSGIDLELKGAYQNGLAAVFYGPESKQHVALPGGTVLEVIPLGVLAFGETFDNGEWRARVSFDMRYVAGLTFRLQAFSLGEVREDRKNACLRASESILVKIPGQDATRR